MKYKNDRKIAINEWYNQYSTSIFKYTLMMVRDPYKAEDITQETFVKAFYNYDSLVNKIQAKTWLFRIARNLTIDSIRKQKRKELLLQLIPPLEKGYSETIEEIIEIKERSKYLYESLGKLKHSYREVIILRKIKGFSNSETAQILNWPESKVKSTLYRALKALEKHLAEEGSYLNELS